MNGLPYYKRYPRDFIEGTVGLPFELKVTYSFVLDLIYLQGGALPDDPRYIAGLLGVSVRKWNSLRNGLIEAGKIQAENGYLSNYRAVIELESLAKLQDKQRENRSGSRKNNDLQKPRSHQPEPEPDIERGGGSACARGETPPFVDQVLSAAKVDTSKRVNGWMDFHVIAAMGRWRNLGLEDAAILETVATTAQRKRDGPANNPNYFDKAMQRAAADLNRPPLEPAIINGEHHDRQSANQARGRFGAITEHDLHRAAEVGRRVAERHRRRAKEFDSGD